MKTFVTVLPTAVVCHGVVVSIKHAASAVVVARAVVGILVFRFLAGISGVGDAIGSLACVGNGIGGVHYTGIFKFWPRGRNGFSLSPSAHCAVPSA